MSHNEESSRVGTPVGPANIQEFPVKPQENDPGESGEYLVDIDTHQTILVQRAESPEDAIAKAVTGNPDGCDLDLDVVAHDVHVCIHTGMGDEDHEEHEEAD
jgi:hypothetical protein